MSIVVAYKYAANPQDTTVGSDGVVDWSRSKAAISEYDPVAIQVARTVADATGDELVGISVGDSQVSSSVAKKAALSRGLDRALVVSDDVVREWNVTAIGAALAGLVRKIDGARLLVTGDSSIDEAAQITSAVVAGHLGWPCFQDVSEVEANGDGWTITQSSAAGTRTITVNGPAVVATTTDAAALKLPGMKDVLAAAKKPLDVVDVAELGIAPLTLEVTGHARPVSKERKKELFDGDDAAVKLVEALRSAGVL
ncbi:electron transfer flavoprotein beta subunit/FixA family protein [uncultured Actinomyces sp.]|uniref:electron transfer flavoprotein subunit beta/FixA family protein n=1 Tax=uncultured Actinomyces sp. TaxID=249061 RepID=UPI0026156B7F|nr:electron transfer flavoprotein beta subunit/FixA family protein [uncultured Actinomyces sp.]